MSSYTYDVAATFPSGYNATKLYKDIRGDVAKPSSFSFSGDTFYLEFSITLSSGQQSTLDNIITNHTPDPDTLGDMQIVTQLQGVSILSTSYTSCGIIVYPGRNIDTLTNIKFVGNVSSGSYSVRIYDLINAQTIAEATFTNTTNAQNDLGTISNVPYIPTLFDVQVKTSSVLVTAFPKSVILYYFNLLGD